jgi:hypothetical protein
MNIVEAVVPSLIELYRKPRKFAIARATRGPATLCYNPVDSNTSSQFIIMSGVNA